MAIYYDIERLPVFHHAVITIGTFDGVHSGHRTILDEVIKHAEQTGGESVLITFEPHPRKLLYPDQPLKLITPLDQKLQLITEAGIQHVIVVPFTKAFASLSAEAYISDFLVKQFHPQTIVIGYDHHFGNDRKGNIHLLKEAASTYNYEVYEISAQLIDEAAISSTKIRHALNNGNIAEAAQMLGRNYHLSGIVQKGAQLGRTIGYPTANVQPSHSEQIVPATGVYAVKVKHHGEWHNAMLNIGYRPTVSSDRQLHIEAHIFNFSTDIYGQELEIAFISRLRNEEKFPSLDALKEQLGKDKEEALRILSV